MKTKIEVFKVTSLKGENFLVESTIDNNPLPKVKVFKQVKSAIEVAEKEFDISRKKEGRKSNLNTREIWSQILQKFVYILIFFLFLNCKKQEKSIGVLNSNSLSVVNDSAVSITDAQGNTSYLLPKDTLATSSKQSDCFEKDQNGSYRNVVINKLQEANKIAQFVEFAGNGKYVVQAYDKEYGVIFGGYLIVNECGEILDIQINVDSDNP